MSGDTADEPTVYAVRLSEGAAGVIESEWDRLDDLAGREVADSWATGIRAAVRGLATYPHRCVVAPEDVPFQNRGGRGTLRQFLYQKRRGGPVWRMLFTISEADGNDPPTVQVLRIRHGAQAPLMEWPTEDEA